MVIFLFFLSVAALVTLAARHIQINEVERFITHSFDQPYCNDAFLYLFIKAQPVVFGDLKKQN